MKTKIYLFAIVLATSFLLNGCAKDGETGPAGPAGANGNANVETLTFMHQYWGGSNSDLYLNVPQITQTVLDQGAILVYMRATGWNEWKVLPSFMDQIDVVIGLNYVNLYNNTGAGWGSFDVKVVIIP